MNIKIIMGVQLDIYQSKYYNNNIIKLQYINKITMITIAPITL